MVNATAAPKYLINCQSGANSPEKATISFILAFTSSKTHETAIFVSADASKLCLRGTAEGITANEYQPLVELMPAYLQNDGQILLRPACAKAKGVQEKGLVPGIEIAGAPIAMAFLASGGQLLA